MKDLKTNCPSCGEHIVFPGEMLGKTTCCPHCQKDMTLSQRNGPTMDGPLPTDSSGFTTYTMRDTSGALTGPLTPEELGSLVAEGRVNGGTLVRRTGFSAWIPLARVPDFSWAFDSAVGDPNVAPLPAVLLERKPSKSLLVRCFVATSVLAVVFIVTHILTRVQDRLGDVQERTTSKYLAEPLTPHVEKARADPSAALDRLRQNARGDIERYCQHATGFRRLMYASVDSENPDPQKWRGEAVYEIVNQVGGVEKKRERFTFTTNGDGFITSYPVIEY